MTFLKHHSWRGEGALFYKEIKQAHKINKKKSKKNPDNFY
jgi:hypothetical protein